jgi:hypothetical protein
MASVLKSGPAPVLRAGTHGAAVPTAYAGVRIDAAVNLLEAREYQGLSTEQRLQKAVHEQQRFINGLLDPSLAAAFDLRTRIDPGRATPIGQALIVRTWGASDVDVRRRAEALRDQVHAALPRHVLGAAIDDPDELDRWLSPLDGSTDFDSAAITHRELTGVPSRPDAKVAYYFSVAPLNWTVSDWTGLYQRLAASPQPLVMSVGLMPIATSAEFSQLLNHYATFYSRLAREDKLQGGLYQSDRTLPADAFAKEAEQVFHDYARRYAGKTFVMRVQLAAPGPLPGGISEAVASTVSPVEEGGGSHLDRERSTSAYEIRHASSDYDRQLARWNLEAVDFCAPSGSPSIWQRPDPPPAALALLSSMGDAKDASCAFRFPIALDGTVPGFKVRRGHFGHVEQLETTGPVITLGSFGGGRGAVTVPVDSLTKHALIAGSTGSGKTTTVLEVLRQLWVDHRIPFLVIEPVNANANDYRRLLAEPGFEDLQIWTIGDESVRPLRFNPFRVPPGVLVGEHLANLLNCFKAAFGLWEPLPGIYEEALSLTYTSAGILPSERADDAPDRFWPTAVEFMRAMRQATANLGYAGEVRANIEAASVRRAQQLTVGVCASTFMTDQQFDIQALMERPTILELKALGAGDEQSLMIALLLNAMTENYQAVRGASATLRHVTVIEEAHRLLARGHKAGGAQEAQAKEQAAEAFANTLAENRKYGEGLIIAEQIPSKLVEDAVKNTNLKVMHRLTAEEERRYLGETMGLDEAQSRFATRLSTGEALVYADEYPEATLAEIKPRLTAALPPPVPAAVEPPFSFCAPCVRQCQFRGAGLAITRDLALRDKINARLAALAEPGLTPGGMRSEYDSLTTDLRSAVAAFSALPSEEPERSHAALCVFVHVMAAQTMKMSASWPRVVAEKLGVRAKEGV